MFESSQRAVVAIAIAVSATLTTPVPALATPEAVSLSIDSSGQYWPDYRLQVRNATPRPISVTVRQELPRGTAVTVASDGGQAEQNELVWRIRVPARVGRRAARDADVLDLLLAEGLLGHHQYCAHGHSLPISPRDRR